MCNLIIEGGKRLQGEVVVQGAKNSVLPILAASLLCSGKTVIHNCPNISDVDISIKILEHLGCKCEFSENTVIIDAQDIKNDDIPDFLMREMRSSVVFLGAIAGRIGSAKISSPGGCELGPRPIDLHLFALQKLGFSISEEHGYIMCKKTSKSDNTVINLSFPSVGATENSILAAALTPGKTIIHNAAREPEIVDLANFLNSAGVKICGAGLDTVIVYGKEKLSGVEYTVIPDRIVAATYLSAAAITKGEITLHNVIPAHLAATINVFEQAGNEFQIYSDKIKISSTKKLRFVPTIRSAVYPGFPTDSGPPIIAMLTVADGTSLFIENIFQNRYKYIDELKRLGAKISIHGNLAVVEGVKSLSGASVESTDLRGGAALVVAGLFAEGITEISKINHILRGYENIEQNLTNLGAVVLRKELNGSKRS